MSIPSRVASELNLTARQVESALELLDQDNTVPFIARYRKDQTDGLDEVELREIEREAGRLRDLESRREMVLETIREQGELDDELEQAIRSAETRSRLDDLYAPYRPKRRTKGAKAVEAGLQPVADAILNAGDIDAAAAEHTCEAYDTPKAVMMGACDIIAEQVADDPEVRDFVRRRMRDSGRLTCRQRRGGDDDPTFEIYYDFSASLDQVKNHQILAIRRGENEKVLSAGIDVDDEAICRRISHHLNDERSGRASKLVDRAIEDGYSRLLHTRIERELRAELEDRADEHAIGVFAVNLENLLLQPPLPDRRVLAIDPGYRTGCKVAIVDETGALVETGQIYVHDTRREEAQIKLVDWIADFDIDVVAIGNGTASRETEEVVAEVVGQLDRQVRYAMVDEAGASVYSASEIAREEFPDLDVSLRGAVSIGRRLQDPLAELVKIDPKSIGVGMYQHDVDQTRLAEALDAVVEDVVHAVGVDLNSASRALLSRVSGIGPTLARRIVEHRDEHGRFQRRRDLRDVRGIGAKTYEQAAGFLRIRDGEEPLDNTAIHPDDYTVARHILDLAGAHLGDPALQPALDELESAGNLEDVKASHDIGELTLSDVLDALVEPGRDPRDDVDPPQLRSDVLTLEDLHEGMELTGTVRNVVDFGAFVDIGVKEDGLVHISEMADRYIENPHEVVGVGDQIDVRVVSVDADRGRIGLSMKPRQ
jgi:uncharacterized protein